MPIRTLPPLQSVFQLSTLPPPDSPLARECNPTSIAPYRNCTRKRTGRWRSSDCERSSSILNDDKEIITLEHILPEHPESNWPQFTPEENINFWRRLGNMVLHSHRVNTTLKNAEFEAKRLRYKECPYELTGQVGRLKNWTPDLIAKRQEKLAIYAVKAWPV